MFGGQLGAVCSPVVIIGLSVLSQIMMKAFVFWQLVMMVVMMMMVLMLQKAHTFTHKRHSQQAHPHRFINFLGVLLPRTV